MDEPHPNNFCGGAFDDWLEVNLTDKCNAKCSWCVERRGWHPENHVDWKTLCNRVLETDKTNIILLGGEPTLHPDIGKIVNYLFEMDRDVWVTTNGSLLTADWVRANLGGVFGVNISIHDFVLGNNEAITGIHLDEGSLIGATTVLREMSASVRFNCNCIQGYVDTYSRALCYIRWARIMGANKVRFAELKHGEEQFVDLRDVFPNPEKYGLNGDPYCHGCNHDAVIDGMPVNFRQMCGMQTSLRPCPKNPVIRPKPVLYYDGKIYDGWQLAKEHPVTPQEIVKMLEDVKTGAVPIAEAAAAIAAELEKKPDPVIVERTRVVHEGGSCRY